MTSRLRLETFEDLEDSAEILLSDRENGSGMSKEFLSTMRNDGETNFTINQYKGKVEVLLNSLERYENLIEGLYGQIRNASEQIADLQVENQKLRGEIVSNKLGYVLKLQRKQEANEIKAKKKTQDLDFLLKDLNSKTVSLVSEKLHHDFEVCMQKQKVLMESKLNSFKSEFAKALTKLENQHESTLFSLKQAHSRQISSLLHTVKAFQRPFAFHSKVPEFFHPQK